MFFHSWLAFCKFIILLILCPEHVFYWEGSAVIIIALYLSAFLSERQVCLKNIVIIILILQTTASTYTYSEWKAHSTQFCHQHNWKGQSWWVGHSTDRKLFVFCGTSGTVVSINFPLIGRLAWVKTAGSYMKCGA